MGEYRLVQVKKRIKDAEVVVIVGAGQEGKRLLAKLDNISKGKIVAFFDNADDLEGKEIQGIPVLKPHCLDRENCLYIISPAKEKFFEQLQEQLLGLGISAKQLCLLRKDYAYFCELDEKYYKDEVNEQYFNVFGKDIDWENPFTYNEILNWEKLNVKDERRTRLADKYLVRHHVRALIGEKYLTKHYGVWDNAYDIDFDALPDSFVLKANNGSGRNIIVKDKKELKVTMVQQQLNEWLKMNYAFTPRCELHYRDITPKIICEEYLEGLAESEFDYNIYCFHGEPQYIQCIRGSHRPEGRASFYDINWNMQSFSHGYPYDPVPAPKPETLEEMLRLSRILSKEFKHVRCDWYSMPNRRVLFSEMTFTSWGGVKPFEPEEYDMVFGKLIREVKL